MSSQKSWPLKPWIILIGFLLAWYLLPTLVKSWVQIGLYELQAPVWTASTKINDLQKYWILKNHSKVELIEAIRDLARLNSSYELTICENASLKNEIARLENHLNLTKTPEYQCVLARVIRRDLSSWSHQIIIQKGYQEGIIRGAAVIYNKGVAGRIKETFPHTSIVELVSSPTFRVTAKFMNDDRPITYKGIANPPFSSPIGESYNIPTDIEASKDNPLQLVSSRLGGTFPDGLAIGTLTEVLPGTDGIFNRGKVSIDPNLHSVQEVAILLPLNLSFAHDDQKP